MTRLTTATLSNCYVPLPLPPPNTIKTREERQKHLIATRSNGDGGSRGPLALRRLLLETSVLSTASGSALVELGHTKVLCRVEGPLTVTDYSTNTINMDEGVLQCDVKYLPLVGIKPQSSVGNTVTTLDSQQVSAGRLNAATMKLESDMSNNLQAALLPSVPLEQFPKCVLKVGISILQDDGSALSACIAAASLALADSNVELYDLVSSCTVAVLRDDIIADPTEDEMAVADASVVIALLPSLKDVTLWFQSGKLSGERASQAVDLARDGCRTMQRFMRQCLIDSSESNKTKR